jgi:hypothetical protein
MITGPGWVVARWVRRAAWWVFVVVALVAGRVSWLNLGNERTVTYPGSHQPLNGVEMTRAFTKGLDISYDVGGDGAWVTPVTAIAAAAVVVAAVLQAVLNGATHS